MLRLTLADYRLDRLSSGEQTGRVCRKSVSRCDRQPVLLAKRRTAWLQSTNWSVASSQCVNRLARTFQPCAGCRMPLVVEAILVLGVEGVLVALLRLEIRVLLARRAGDLRSIASEANAKQNSSPTRAPAPNTHAGSGRLSRGPQALWRRPPAPAAGWAAGERRGCPYVSALLTARATATHR
jgi:hypothetical protein